MKKIIALLLALMMTFSVATVAFATEAEAPEADTETTAPEAPEEDKPVSDQLDEMLGEYDWILDLPFGTVKPALKIAKIALKFLKVYLKICDVFHLDPMDTAKAILDYVGGVLEDNGVEIPGTGEEAPEEAPAEPETTAAAAA